VNSNEKIDVSNIKQKLLDFQNVYEQYANEINENQQQSKIDEIRHRLQIMEPQITQYILQIVGPGSLIIGGRTYRSEVVPIVRTT
jgi:hypothetical protein